MIKKIMVPLDGSELAEHVLPYVKEIASRAKAEVQLVTAVQELGVWDATLTITVMDREEQLAADYLREKAQELKAQGLKVSADVLRGAAADVIEQTAESGGVDLVALTTHGRSGLTRWLFGSVSGKLVQKTEIPLFVLRQKGDEPPPANIVIDKILVPLDGSPTAESVLPFVEDLAKLLGASIVLFHAITPLTAYPGFEMGAATNAGDILNDLQEQARQILARVAEAVKKRGLKVEAMVTIDLAVDAIVRTAKETGCDIIALGTHGRGGLGRAVLGSVADGVVRHATVPCLLVNPEEEKDQGSQP